jgi:hypothetical protein
VTGPPAWIVWVLAVTVAAIPLCLVGAVMSALIDRRANTSRPARQRPKRPIYPTPDRTRP